MIQIPARFRMTWDQVRPRILPRLLSTEWHSEYVKDLVKLPVVADIVETFYIDVHDFADCPDVETHAHIAVTYDLLRHLDKSIDDLVAAVAENTRDTYTVKPLGQLMSEMFGAPAPEAESPLVVVTNTANWCASAGILNPTIQQDLTCMLGEDFYVLPSSVHEVLCVSSDTVSSVDDLVRMVRTINREVVEADDCLSDHVFQIQAGRLVARG